MDLIKPVSDWLLAGLTAIISYLFYQNKKTEAEIKADIDKLKKDYHRLDRSQAEIAVEIKEIKKDIGYIRKGMDKVIEKL